MELNTTRVTASDEQDAVSVSTHPHATDDERAAAAHVDAAYHLRAVCEREAIAIVQSAGQRLKLW